MLKDLLAHRWVCWVQGGMTLLLGMVLLAAGHLMTDSLSSAFAIAAVLLSSGLVLFASGIMDLAVAVDVSVRRHAVRPALNWLIPGGIGICGGAVLVLTPHLTVSLLAVMAAIHAILVAGMDLSTIGLFRRHSFQFHVSLVSSLGFAIFAALLVVGALGTEGMATKSVGLYAVYFGSRFLCLGWESSRLRPLVLAVRRPR